MSARRRQGFTLVELLVVITIMGMLMAMIFPAVGGIIESVNRTGCANNLKSVNQGLNLYESSKKGYPGLVEAGGKSKKYPDGVPMTWAASILDQLDNAPMFESWVRPEEGKEEMVAERVKVYICASDIRDDLSSQQLSYVINAGSIEDARNPAMAGVVGRTQDPRLIQRLQSNGIAFNRYNPSGDPPKRVSKSAIANKKGLANMLVLSENVQAWNWGDKRDLGGNPAPYDNRLQAKNAGAVEAQMFTGFVWDGLMVNRTENEDQDVARIEKAPNPLWARPSSNHPGGVNMVFANDNIRFVQNRIAPHVYQYLCMTDPARALVDDPKKIFPRVRDHSPSDDDF